MSVKVVCDSCGGMADPSSTAAYGPAPWRRVSGHTRNNRFITVDFCSAECEIQAARSFGPPEEEKPRLELVPEPDPEWADRNLPLKEPA